MVKTLSEFNSKQRKEDLRAFSQPAGDVSIACKYEYYVAHTRKILTNVTNEAIPNTAGDSPLRGHNPYETPLKDIHSPLLELYSPM